MIEILDQIFTVGPQIIAAATGVTIFAKSNNSNPWINMLLKVLNCLSGNVGKNKNADDHG